MATVYSFQRPADPLHGVTAIHGPSRFLDPPWSASHFTTPCHRFNLRYDFRLEGFEARLLQFEDAARKKYFRAIDDMPALRPADWFLRQLEYEILPALTRIGFEEYFVRGLFQIAASSWQRMGPLKNDCIWFCPDLIRNLNLIREELSQHPGVASGASWIALPRVYRFLEEEQSAYLICYLDYLADDPAAAFRKILTRVIIEFVGNYALKFGRSNVSGCRAEAALFHGYATMFWKNMQNPPPGFENDLIFNHYLRWLKFFPGRCPELGEDMTRSVAEMEAWRQKVMLTENSFQSADKDGPSLGRLLVALRHGHPGTQAAIEFMGNWLCSFRRDPAVPSISRQLPAAVNKLLQAFKKRLPFESAEVHKSLRKFLVGLHENIVSTGITQSVDSPQPSDKFRFVGRRLLGVIDGTAASLV